MMKNKNNKNEIKILNFDAGSSAKVNTKKKWYPIDLNVEAPPSPDYSQVYAFVKYIIKNSYTIEFFRTKIFFTP